MICVGNSQGALDEIKAWVMSARLMLYTEEWAECFADGRDNKELALKYSRRNFKKMHSSYLKRARDGNFSEKMKKKCFNVFYKDNVQAV